MKQLLVKTSFHVKLMETVMEDNVKVSVQIGRIQENAIVAGGPPG